MARTRSTAGYARYQEQVLRAGERTLLEIVGVFRLLRASLCGKNWRQSARVNAMCLWGCNRKT